MKRNRLPSEGLHPQCSAKPFQWSPPMVSQSGSSGFWEFLSFRGCSGSCKGVGLWVNLATVALGFNAVGGSNAQKLQGIRLGLQALRV